MTEPKRTWLYDERQAFIVLRKAIQKKPWMVEELIRRFMCGFWRGLSLQFLWRKK